MKHVINSGDQCDYRVGGIEGVGMTSKHDHASQATYISVH